MVIDGTKGVEAQTYKLFEVCRLRNMPVLTFVNKFDREAMDPIDICDEIEEKLQLQVCPLSWPIGMGKTFKGVYSIYEKRLLLFNPHGKQEDSKSVEITDLNDPKCNELLGEDLAQKLRDDIELVEGEYTPLKREDYLSGHVSPICFGSALNNFGVRELLDCFVDISPPPTTRETDIDTVAPDSPKFSGFVFKIHANMDPKHRDRIAFMRICSGTFERNKKLLNVRSGKQVKFSNPTAFMAQEKSIVDKAFPGDIIGLHDTGNLKIGDT